MKIQTYWTDSVGQLFLNRQTNHFTEFHQSMETLYEHLRDKHEGRCLSKKIHIESERKIMIEELFTSYCMGVSSHELCQSRFMRKLAKHDPSSNPIPQYIELIVELQLKNFQLEELQDDLEVKLWLKNYNTCVSNPEKLVSYCELYSGIPTEFLDLLRKESTKLNEKLIEAFDKGWITESKIEDVIDIIEKEKWHEFDTKCVDFTEQSIVHYLAFKYYLLIKSGDEYADKFKKIFLIDLRIFINKE